MPNTWHLKIHGGPYQRAGIPDLVIAHEGDVIFMEIKRRDGDLSPLQIHEAKKIRHAGIPVYCIRSIEEAREVLLSSFGVVPSTK
jgi:hypothetical protein